MREFFRGWKRKTGCVTLAMACVLTTTWLRSQSRSEVIYLNKLAPRYILISGSGGFQIFEGTIVMVGSHDLGDGTSTEPELKLGRSYHGPNKLHQWLAWPKMEGWQNLKIPTKRSGEPHDLMMIPYWSIVVPLTLLSACLLLSKPRTGKRTELQLIPTASEP